MRPGDERALHVMRLSPDFAPAAARLHIAGQPGTFLTELGPEVLTVLYRTLPASVHGFGYAVVEQSVTAPTNCSGTESSFSVRGFVSATTSVTGLFLEMGTRRLPQVGPPLAKRLVRRPALALRSIQTAFYPFLVHTNDGVEASAELLSIMVAPGHRGLGIGALLMQALIQDCRNRQINLLDITVDAENDGAQRFYTRFGFELVKAFVLHGRAMRVYRLTL